jgi:hypothetical protein
MHTVIVDTDKAPNERRLRDLDTMPQVEEYILEKLRDAEAAGTSIVLTVIYGGATDEDIQAIFPERDPRVVPDVAGRDVLVR